MKQCCQCPTPVEGPNEDLCTACAVELAYRIMAAEPEPVMPPCDVCGAPYSLTEARVLRNAKNPRAGSAETPRLCWVCAHLHLSALRPETIPAMYF